MPNLASAKKRLRQNAGRKFTNQVIKTRIKNTVKSSIESGDITLAAGTIDRAAAKGVIHKNAAARHKSRLAKRIATAAASA